MSSRGEPRFVASLGLERLQAGDADRVEAELARARLDSLGSGRC